MTTLRLVFRKFWLVAALVVSFSHVKAQIVYVSPSSGILLQNLTAPYLLDMDSDGVVDFKLQMNDYYQVTHVYEHIGLICLVNGSAVAGNSTSYTHTYGSGVTLDSTTNMWCTSQLSSCDIFGDCWGTGNSASYFIGVRFLIGTETHYGWIGIINNCDHAYIIDWAYNTQADSAIATGQTYIAGIPQEPAIAFANLFSDGHSILVQLTENVTATVSVYDNLGQLVSRQQNASGEMKIEMGNNKPGVYFVEVLSGGKYYSKKIYIQ